MSDYDREIKVFLGPYVDDPRLLEAVYVWGSAYSHPTSYHAVPWGTKDSQRILEEEFEARNLDISLVSLLDARLKAFNFNDATKFKYALIDFITKNYQDKLVNLVKSRINSMSKEERNLLSSLSDYLMYIDNKNFYIDSLVSFLKSIGIYDSGAMLRAIYTLYRAGIVLMLYSSVAPNGRLYSYTYVKVPPWTIEALKSLSQAPAATQTEVPAAIQGVLPVPEEAQHARPPEAYAKPSREILEGIVAKVLEDLGFHARVNDRRPSRVGSDVEVDVWAEKVVGNKKFSVYVSCKNWNSDVDRSTVDEEFGRAMNLREIPTLRLLVVGGISEPAKEVARADGFFVIELGEAAREEEAERAYGIIKSELKELFMSIAPPELLEIAERVESASKVLADIANDLRKLSEIARM